MMIIAWTVAGLVFVASHLTMLYLLGRHIEGLELQRDSYRAIARLAVADVEQTRALLDALVDAVEERAVRETETQPKPDKQSKAWD